MTKFSSEKSSVYDLYKWCIVVLYGCYESDFHWPNFKDEAFGLDKGADFISRLKGLKTNLAIDALRFTERILQAGP